MAKPVIQAVDDEPEVLRAFEGVRRRRYGAAYRDMRAESGATAPDVLREFRLRGEAMGLIVTDQRCRRCPVPLFSRWL